MKILNLYAGIGGNRKLWGDEHEIVAVELDAKIASVYKRLYTSDTVIIADAHKYLIENYDKFDFIWASPPCQSHSKMSKATRHKNKKYPDMKLYQEIIFLQNFYKGDWVIENVEPFYSPLVEPTVKIGRHLFWSNKKIFATEEKSPSGFINKSNMDGKKELMDWLDIHFEEKLYYDGNHCPCQVLRNCVHPKVGAQILDSIMDIDDYKQGGLFDTLQEKA